MQFNKLIRNIAIVATSALAAAQNVSAATEWRVLGPAFSKHLGHRGAVVDQAASRNCEPEQYGSAQYVTSTTQTAYWGGGQSLHKVDAQTYQVFYPNPNAGGGTNVALVKMGPDNSLVQPGQFRIKYVGANAWSFQASEGQRCTLQPASYRPWVQANGGVGLSRVERSDDGLVALSYFANYVVDSYGHPSLLAGISKTVQIASYNRLQIEAGYLAGAWSRTLIAGEDDSQARRATIPFAMPIVNLTDPVSGFGITVGVIPKATIANMGSGVTTWMVQTSMRASESDSVSFSTEPKAIKVIYKKTF